MDRSTRFVLFAACGPTLVCVLLGGCSTGAGAGAGDAGKVDARDARSSDAADAGRPDYADAESLPVADAESLHDADAESLHDADAGSLGAGDAEIRDGGNDDLPFAAMRAACAFSAGATPASTFGPSVIGAAMPIDTFVIIAQENRSFDHYFSQLPAYGQPDVDVASPNATNLDGQGQPIARFHQTSYCFADTKHSWNAMHMEWNGGSNDGFVIANDPDGARSMGYFDDGDIPFYYGLANAFGTCDRYFSPTLSSTGPNRYYLYAATSAGAVGNSDPAPPYSQTIFARLQAAGVTLKVYTNTSTTIAFAYETAVYPELGLPRPFSEYVRDAAAGTLPNVVFVYPGGDSGADEHPPSNMQLGEAGVADVFAALVASPQWIRSAFILTYDEAGGLYDHAPPPPACAPDAIPPALAPTDVPGDFGRYGFRVPIIVASAWSKPHYVSHVVHDHTSILRLIELRFGLPALSARDANANALLDLFDFSRPSFPTGPALPQATIDPSRCR
jgi:phospholipase C